MIALAAEGAAAEGEKQCRRPPEVYARATKQLNSFLSDDWNPDDSPLRPRGRRYGW